MINRLYLNSGTTPSSAPLEFDTVPITVFVGPNNSGKSKILEEIEHYCRTGGNQTNFRVLDHLDFTSTSHEEVEADVGRIEQEPRPGEVLNAGHVLVGKVNPQNNTEIRTQIDRQLLLTEAADPNRANARVLGQFLRMYTLRLDGRSRLNLVGEQNAGDLQTASTNHLTKLFVDDALREEVRRIVADAFGTYLVIDPTNIGKLRLRLSERPPADSREEKGWDERSLAFHREAISMDVASDGVRAFVGIIATILAGDPRFILIDEPEAFLHPALAHKLGKELAASLVETRKRLFVATHSSSFLMGCIQSGVPVNVVRLTYNFAPPTARLLPQERMLDLMRQPLLRSTGVLSGLFYETVVVTESDTDRAFYQEINERLVAANDERGIPNALFVNAQNKQTVWTIVKPLRELGIPVGGIVDIDVLLEGGQNFTKVLDGAFVPEVSHEGLHRLRGSIAKAAETKGASLKRDGGIGALDDADKEGATNLLEQLAQYGVFVVRNGELESWLSDLGATGHGPAWLMDIFERIGSDPSDQRYIHPGPGDIWEFIGEIREWSSNVERRGIPA